MTLPDGKTLTTSNQTTVTVTDQDGEPVKGISVTIKDASTSAKGTTNVSGKVTLPVRRTSSGGSYGGSYGGGSFSTGGSSSQSDYTATVTDKDGKTVNATVSTANGKVTVTLPDGRGFDDEWYTVTVKNGNGVASDVDVTLKNKAGTESYSGVTNSKGVVVLPATLKHKLYITGYEDGTFKPQGSMTRAEAATIFARLISEEYGEKITGKSSFKDVNSGSWYSSYVGYLEDYGIINGYTDGTFQPQGTVTRAEFVAMSVRYYNEIASVSYGSNTAKYSDLASDHWAIKDISYATGRGWLNGYADGTFKPGSDITRAEVVSIVNRVTNRTPDKSYIDDNYTRLERFTDVTDSSFWAFYDILEAANTHGVVGDTETWVD